jgi:hypothetical protein
MNRTNRKNLYSLSFTQVVVIPILPFYIKQFNITVWP